VQQLSIDLYDILGYAGALHLLHWSPGLRSIRNESDRHGQRTDLAVRIEGATMAARGREPARWSRNRLARHGGPETAPSALRAAPECLPLIA